MICQDVKAVSALVVVIGLMVTALAGCNQTAAQPENSTAGAQVQSQDKQPAVDTVAVPGKGMVAIKQAADAGKYLFVFFSKAEDEQTLAMRKVYDKAMEKMADRARAVAVNVTDASEKDIVDKFDLSRSPMPLVLAMAPNGAITGGFPTKFEEQQLIDAFASLGTTKVVKQLQDGKLVFVCVQNDKTKSNDVAMQGVRDFKADARFASATEIVTLDPTDKKEATLLTDLKVPVDTAEAITVFIVPPGQAIGKFEGATSKDALVELLSKTNTSGCGSGGCGPGGCGPKK
ncbi:MAG: glutamate-cysteine ligase family protein [Planctomycetota bacterium]